MKIADATFLVTGGASGLGRACVEHFAQRGARVVLADLNEPAAARLAESPQVHFHRTDVTSSDDVEAALDAALRLGPLKAVIQCAGILVASKVIGRSAPHDLETFARAVQVNLIGTFNVLRLAAWRMAQNEPDEHGERGVLIQTASVAACEGQMGQAAYAASKGGVAAMTLPAARDLARHGIRVVAIAPGVFQTPMIDTAPEKVQAALAEHTVFPKRFGDPREFAAFAEQIVTNPMLNGAVLRLDGAVRMPP